MPGKYRGPGHTGRALEALLDDGGAARARWILEQRLTETPDDHALWAALSFTWFEEGRLEVSLDAADRAQAAAPGCGLVQWYRANLLAALGREAPARALFRALEEAGEALLSSGSCALDADRARQMVQRAQVWLTLDARGARRMPEPQLRLGPDAERKPPTH